MKSFIKIMSLAAILPMVLFSCKRELPQYEPGEPDVENCYGVYFPAAQEAAGSHTFDPTAQRKVTVTVARSDKQPVIDQEITVPYVLTESESGIFQVGQIVFASGQAETTVDITFDDAVEGEKYDLTLELKDPQYVSTYTANPTSFSMDVMVVAYQYILNPQTGEKCLFTFTLTYWGETAFSYIKYYEVDGVMYCFTETLEDHIYKEPYKGWGFWGNAAAQGEGEIEFRIYTKDLNSDGYMFVELLPNVIQYNSTYSANVYMLDNYYYWTGYADSLDNHQASLEGLSWLDFAKQFGKANPLGYYDGKGGIYFYIKARGMYGIGGWSMGTYDTFGIGEGFIRTDYEFKAMEADYPSDGKTPIYVETGRDVAKLKYAIYPGKLKDAEVEKKVAAIVAETETSEEFTDFAYDEDYDVNYATLYVSPEATGEYTFVGVGYDAEDKYHDTYGFVKFNYISAEDEDEYTVTLSVFTEDTPARYQKLHKYDSFAIGISGEDITEAHMGIFNEATVTKYGTDYIYNIVKTAGKDYALSEAQVASINADGGLYDVATQLPAKTTFYVVVWGTNGSMDKFAVASYTTDKLPYVWNSLGQGTLTDGLFVDSFSSRPDYTVPCDIYEEKSTPGLYMITGFQCELMAAFFSISPETMAQYKGSNWDDAEVIIDATNPAAVFIEEQNYGVSPNPTNYGWILVETEKTGTLVDGVISWPTREMYYGYEKTGGWYYGNKRGTFNITLPNANEPTALTPVKAVPGAKVEDVDMVSGTLVERPVEQIKYERDAQQVKAKVSVSHERREKATEAKAEGAMDRTVVSFK